MTCCLAKSDLVWHFWEFWRKKIWIICYIFLRNISVYRVQNSKKKESKWVLTCQRAEEPQTAAVRRPSPDWGWCTSCRWRLSASCCTHWGEWRMVASAWSVPPSPSASLASLSSHVGLVVARCNRPFQPSLCTVECNVEKIRLMYIHCTYKCSITILLKLGFFEDIMRR